ncbi:MAG: hypothetical protein AUG51_20880 [Acidobacteria bacterium 13_1_20CM_3_53_8]|nr:MAG: hypothetical protein AUH05_06555 [Ktedonobacter sp. 13_2_20CM_53_11]OLE51878.1 MAG: hypothetical protein AUG51_20880 [Acidobacteria bacterium 13_1_20CM_3_53_8]
MNNPYWEEIRSLFVSHDEEDYHWFIKHSEARDKCCRKYAWAIADPASVAFVARYLGPRAVEIGAGTGYWAWQLWQQGIDIIAFDHNPPDKVPNDFFAPRTERPSKTLVKTWYPVTQGSSEVLSEHPNRTLFLCWPNYATDFAAQCLQAYQGNRFVFIGENEGGCTGNADFFDLLEKEWQQVDAHQILQWSGIHDTIVVYERSS